MSFEQRGHMPLDYHPVAYPGSVLRFRGPVQTLEDPFILCLGGSETFGRFIHAPYATQLGERLDLPVVNMGVMNAGLDVLMQDPAIKAASKNASAIILQVTGAHNMTNRFYVVHPRRNDRFLKATTMLRTIYREVDFTEFHFTRHLLTHLKGVSAERFMIVQEELQTAWAARMARFLDRISAPVHLLWLSNRRPESGTKDRGLGGDPLFVTDQMLKLAGDLAASVTVAVPAGHKSERQRTTQGMFFAAREEAAARVLPGPDAHDTAAGELLKVIQGAETKNRPAVLTGR